MPHNIMSIVFPESRNLEPTIPSGSVDLPLWRHGDATTLAVGVSTQPTPAVWTAQGGLAAGVAVTPLTRAPRDWTGTNVTFGEVTMLEGEPARLATFADNWTVGLILSDPIVVETGDFVLIECLVTHPDTTQDPYFRIILRGSNDDFVTFNFAHDENDPGSIASNTSNANRGTTWSATETGFQVRPIAGAGVERVWQLRGYARALIADAGVTVEVGIGAKKQQDLLISQPLVSLESAEPIAGAFRDLPLIGKGAQYASWTGTRSVPSGVGILAPRPTSPGVLIEASDGTTTLQLRQTAGGGLQIGPAGESALLTVETPTWTANEALPVSLWFDGSNVELWLDGAKLGEAAQAFGPLTGVTLGAANGSDTSAGVEIVRASLTGSPYWQPPFELVQVADEATAEAQIPHRFFLIGY